MYELFEHTADLGLRVEAPSLDELFQDAAEGLFAIIADRFDVAKAEQTLRFQIKGRRRDYLLFDWLNELLYTFDTERVLLGRFVVRVGEAGLRAEAAALVLDESRHRLLHEVKAITYHRFRVDRTFRGWLAELIVDI